MNAAETGETDAADMAVQSANVALQTGPISKEVRDALDAELAVQERMEGFAWALKSDRAWMAAYDGAIPFRNFWLVRRGVCNMQQSACLDLFPMFLPLAGDAVPTAKRNSGLKATSRQWPSRCFRRSTQRTGPSRGCGPRFAACGCSTPCKLRVPAGSDETPKLTDLGLPAETITDPFSGEPLHVKRLPQGWLVYSVGPNLRDDGGTVDDPRDGDVGVGPPPETAKP